ncbi:hypothetical protein H6F76_12915 [Leptolyngbya sp. FACHB-321]|uniref:hypothetical protein n=1 Tax=Leptolyngbya sp. FACHB-321 TaxID=2692807 RepID=UPI0016857A86|nr:hypothetical protein [Leptolyngbya sp. FACHB-321]MBD2035919.1 hypothetical protein [Leptolyngbya sp. FACHB-321]
MKCIRCSTDNTLKDRTDNQGRCKNCQHPFAFEPTAMGTVKVTDPMFAKAIADLSANNTLFFTPKQFLYFFDKRLRTKNLLSAKGCLLLYLVVTTFMTLVVGSNLFTHTVSVLMASLPAIAISLVAIVILASTSQSRKTSNKARQSSAKALQIIGGVILAAGIGVSIIGNSFPLFAISVLLGVGSFYYGRRQSRQMLIHQQLIVDAALFQGWLDRWQQINGFAANMLPPAREDRTPATVNSDITAYSFDRLVVCSSAAIAQILIANNFHFENNCAILSITGYPQSIFDTTMGMLRRNPELKVYAFHDCSARGVGLVHQLRSSAKWFQNSSVEIFDVGLLPRQIFPSKSMFIQNTADAVEAAKQMSPEVRSSLSEDEIIWLEAGNVVELESFTPQQLIHILNRGTVSSRELGSDDSSLISIDSSYGNSYYAVESFG